MLNIKKVTNDIIEIEEIIMGFTSTKKTYSYKNTSKNLEYMDPRGKKINPLDIPIDKWQSMPQTEIDWINTYYIPKIA